MTTMDEFYRIPLTSGEALATLATLKALSKSTDASGIDIDLEPGILASAVERIEAELPEYVVEQAERLSLSLAASLGSGNSGAFGEEIFNETTEPPFPIGRTRRLLQDAFDRDRQVEIEYFVRSRKEWTTRHVDIMGVHEDDGVWHLRGHCRLRGDCRQFRLDHIRAVRVLDTGEENDTGHDAPDPFRDE